MGVEIEKAVCPYCGEIIQLAIDCSIHSQEYIEDCQVCCRPMTVKVLVSEDGILNVEAVREDE